MDSKRTAHATCWSAFSWLAFPLVLALCLAALARADQPAEPAESMRDLPRLITSVSVHQGEFEGLLSEYVRWGSETTHQQVEDSFEQFRSSVTELTAMVGHTEQLLAEYREEIISDVHPETADEHHSEANGSDDLDHGHTEHVALASFERTKHLLTRWSGNAGILITRISPKVDVLEEGDAILHQSMRRQLDSLGDVLLALQLAAFERQSHIDHAIERREQSLARQIRLTYIALAAAGVFALLMLGFFLRQKARDSVALQAANERLQGKVEEANNLAAQLEYNATHDQLTELHNRHSFSDKLDHAFTDTTTSHGIVFIDLDKFKAVNDNCGHAAGDELLRRIGELLSRQAGGRGIAARFGGDEFVLLLPGCGLGILRGVAISTCELMSQLDFQHDDQRYPVGASIGAVLFESSTTTPAHLMQVVDEACYESKNQGGGSVVFRDLCSPSLDGETSSNVSPIKKVA